MTHQDLLNAGFTLERVLDAPPARVFAAYASAKAKLAWLGCHSNQSFETFEFRPGGREVGHGGGVDSPLYRFEGEYQFIEQDRHIAYTYAMFRDGVRFSASVASITLYPDGQGTQLVFTEHSVFTSGPDTPAQREEGTAWGLDQLVNYMAKADA